VIGSTEHCHRERDHQALDNDLIALRAGPANEGRATRPRRMSPTSVARNERSGMASPFASTQWCWMSNRPKPAVGAVSSWEPASARGCA
jgi:hypothetical protein